MAESIAHYMNHCHGKSHTTAMPEAFKLPYLKHYRGRERFFSAGRYTHVISLLLPSTRGGVNVVKRGVNLSLPL